MLSNKSFVYSNKVDSLTGLYDIVIVPKLQIQLLVRKASEKCGHLYRRVLII